MSDLAQAKRWFIRSIVYCAIGFMVGMMVKGIYFLGIGFITYSFLTGILSTIFPLTMGMMFFALHVIKRLWAAYRAEHPPNQK